MSSIIHKCWQGQESVSRTNPRADADKVGLSQPRGGPFLLSLQLYDLSYIYLGEYSENRDGGQ